MPYRTLVAEGPVGVMIGHMRVPGLTGNEPASLNRDAVALLRNGNGYGAPAFDGPVLTDDLFAMKTNQTCGSQTRTSIPHMGLNAAAGLLTHPTEPASYVCVSDVGLERASGGGGYDTHSGNAQDQAMNFDNMLDALFGVINKPGENNPRKLNLDDTLIILNTEFGRTPGRQGSTGRNHHPYGYVTAFIGGPIQNAHKGVSGAIEI